MQNEIEQCECDSILHWESVFQAIAQPTLVLDTQHVVIAANRAALNATGLKLGEIVGTKCYQHFHNPDSTCPPDGCPLMKVLESGSLESVEMEMEALGGSYMVTATPVVGKDGRVDKIIHTATDITAKKKSEKEKERLKEQLEQAQKMEAIGRLAGGVAHDFNNILSVILGYAEVVMDQLGAEHQARPDLEEIRVAAGRAADITKQLLAFSRKQVLELRVFNPNQAIRDMEKMLGRLIREDIVLEFELDERLYNIEADWSQIQQIVLNLVLNARDAMPKGGKTLIMTRNQIVDEHPAVGYMGIKPGSYVEITVKDEGQGIQEEIKEHIFEPFFTTKGCSQGTGLGLATVYGIVQQHGGGIMAESQPGKGATIRVWLPKTNRKPLFQTMLPLRSNQTLGGETVMVVEDAEAVRRLAKRILDQIGYNTLEALSAKEALEKSQSHPRPIHLLLTDVVLPDNNGKELFDTLKKSRPDLKVVYMTGHADETIARHGILNEKAGFLQKPFTIQSLTKAVRRALDRLA